MSHKQRNGPYHAYISMLKYFSKAAHSSAALSAIRLSLSDTDFRFYEKLIFLLCKIKDIKVDHGCEKM